MSTDRICTREARFRACILFSHFPFPTMTDSCLSLIRYHAVVIKAPDCEAEMADCSQSRCVSATGFLVAYPQTISRFVAHNDGSIECECKIPEEHRQLKVSIIFRNAFLFKKMLKHIVKTQRFKIFRNIIFNSIKCVHIIF